jgi:uncharacterized protein
MQNDHNFISLRAVSRALIAAGALLGLGLVAGAYVLGAQTKHIGAGRSTIAVKGLAEKHIKADLAEWQVSASATGATLPEALAKLRQQKQVLDRFLEEQGFDATTRTDGPEAVGPRYVEREVRDRVVREQAGFEGQQVVVIRTTALDKIAAASKAVLDFQAKGNNVGYSSPSYLVSNLEEVKLSLIGAATENAKKRGQEFARYGDAQLGPMRSASQGAFYILPDTAGASADDYGGSYDKTTVDKIARVVVSLEYSLK